MRNWLICIFICCITIGTGETLFAQEELPDINELVKVSPEQQAKIDAALALMEQVKKAGAYIESLQELLTNQTIPLPVGIKKGEYELIIQKITYDNAKSKFFIFASCAFKFKDDGEVIAFEGMSEIEGQKGLGSSGYLKLIAPVKRDMGEQASLIVLNDTKVNFGCEGIESFDAKLGLVLTSEKFIAVDKKGKPTGKQITASFETSFTSFDQYTASLDIDKSFMFKGLDDVIFSLKGAVIDQDDLTTPKSIQFPVDYFEGENTAELNLWRGISISEASVALPKALERKGQADTNSIDGRITLNLKKVLIDNNGFTAFVEANNVLHSDALPKDEWAMSIEDIKLQMQKNSILGFGFGGDLNIPPFGDNSLTPYRASYNASINEYEFVAGLKGNYNFPVFKAKLELLETSSIEIVLRDSRIYPAINASGILSIDAPMNDTGDDKKFTVPDINFEQLKISSEDPYVEIGAIGVSGDLRSPKVAGFELTISDIGSFDDSTGTGLSFNTGIKISDMFIGEAGIQLHGDYNKFKFSKVTIDEARVAYISSSFAILGGVVFKNGDAFYGTGFRGELGLTVFDKFNLEAVGVFGKKDNERYFLTDVFYSVDPSAGIPVGVLSFYGFGGGLYNHMQQSTLDNDSDFGKTLSGINYVPDQKIGLGFMASTKFGLMGASKTFNADVSFEIQFNNSGGVNFAQLRGDGVLMADPDKLGGLAAKMNQKVKEKEKNKGELKETKKSDLKVPKVKNNALLTASMNFVYDVENETFNADLAAYLNAGFIKGIGENGKMGWASAYVAPDSWYTYIGTPTDRLGIEILGLAKATSYFMIGDNIPELPLPPNKVLRNFSSDKVDKIKRTGFDKLGSGKGIAFGQSLEVGFDATLFPFYASMHLGIGGEFLLKNYGASAYCAGSSGSIGMDGWYAKGQVWAYAQAAIGMRAKLFGKNRTFDILDISAGALLRGEGPNPFYFSGMVGGRYSVMGGLLSGQCDFEFELGERCIIRGGSPFGEDVIASLTPTDTEKDVNVFTTPQMVMNIPANLSMRIEEAPGLYGDYKINIVSFTVRYKETQQEIPGIYELSSDGKTYMLNPNEPFESFKEIEMIAKVGFQRKVNGQWINEKGEDGKDVIEEKSYTFTSGERPDQILPEHVKYAYPIDRQFNFYPDEYDKGYLLLSQNYAYLFTTDKPEGFDQVIRIKKAGNLVKDLGFTFTTASAGSDIRMEINYNLASISFTNNAIYNIALINKPNQAVGAINSNISSQTSTQEVDGTEVTITTQQAQGNKEVLEIKEIYHLDFRVSNYNTLADKMTAIGPRRNAWRKFLEPNVHDIKANVLVQEGFDKYEYDQTNQLISIEADLANTNWYKGSVYEDMYTVVNKVNITRSSTLEKLGFPPAKGVEFRNVNETKILSEDEIELGNSSFIAIPGNMTYSIPYWASLDYYQIQKYLSTKLIHKRALTNKEKGIIATQVRHRVTKGAYPIKLQYLLPGKNKASSTIKQDMYNPIN